jgi:CRP-like cAMP-binding protein
MPGSKKTEILNFPADKIIFREGDFRTYLYIVQKGQIAIYKMSYKNERLPLGIISSGEYLGETGLLDLKPQHSTWAQALTDVELIAIPVSGIIDQLKSAPSWLIALSRGLSQKLRRMNDLVKRNGVSDEDLINTFIAIHENDEKAKAAKAHKKKAPPK